MYFVKNTLAVGFLMLTYMGAIAQNNTLFLEPYLAPSLGFKLMFKAKAPNPYYQSENFFKDSLRKADGPLFQTNFGVQFTKKNDYGDKLSFGLSYTKLGFSRERTNLRIGTLIHPEVGDLSGLYQADMRILYNFTYRYVSANFLYCKNITAQKNYEDFTAYFVYGGSAAGLLSGKTHIVLEGFNKDGKDAFWVNNAGIKPLPFNIFFITGARTEIDVFKNTQAIITPTVTLPLLPSATGAQSFLLPQLSLNIGLSINLNPSPDSK